MQHATTIPEDTDASTTSSRVGESNETSALTKSLAKRETRVVNVLRVALLGVLLTTAALVSTVVYVITRKEEHKRFSISFENSANQIVESFHSAVERNLAAAAALSNSITSHAIHSNQDFPFVTVPDFELLGSDFRALSGSHYVYWSPLVSLENKEVWEEYALDNRQQWTESYERDVQYIHQQDKEYGLPPVNQTGPLQLPRNVPGLTVLSDDQGDYHPKLWSNGGNGLVPLGDSPDREAYVPIWQQSPFPFSEQYALNTDIAGVRTVSQNMIQTMVAEKKALMHRASQPHPAYKAFFEWISRASQYRHKVEDLLDGIHSMISYPVFSSLDDGSELAGILLSGIYWNVLFSHLLPSDAEGIIVVVENTFNETFAYRIDGDQATSLGVGDPHDKKYDDMGVSTNVNSYMKQRASPDNRAYKTVHISDSIQYTIRIYPSDETAGSFLTNAPAIYTVVVLCAFLFASVLFLLYSCVVEHRQRVMTEKVIEHVNRAAETERELNEFLSHEVRNPLSAAIAACTFVSTAVNEEEPLKDDETRSYVRSDVDVVQSSLQFINDFLRSMLDIYRATANRISVQLAPTDLLQDVLQPVSGIFNQRLYTFDVIVECPSNLIVKTDTIRLKQVILNLARNATKFVEKGFLRMRVDVVNNLVRIYVEDSGPGISPKKQKELFSKYQESLDLLSQGTGIGLNLSKKLMKIMNGDVWLDESYDSGVEGCPGARFVVDLRTPQIDIESALQMPVEEVTMVDVVPPKIYNGEVGDSISGAKEKHEPPMEASNSTETTEATNDGQMGMRGARPPLVSLQPKPTLASTGIEATPDDNNMLPDGLSVLFVDDDAMLRKLFMRAVKRAAPPTWNIQEASSGEVALKLCEEQQFNIIFLDQYMASVDKQLLGTETAEVMRTKGVTSKICGLSANDLRDAFVNAGADDFILKPMPCKPAELKQILQRILTSTISTYRKKGSCTSR